jgi:hypothetical protein
MSFLKLTGGKLITGLTLVSAVEGALVVHNKYKNAMLERREEFSKNHEIKPQINKTISDTVQEHVQTTVTNNSQSKIATISDSFNYLLWGESKNINLTKPNEVVQTRIQSETQGWLDWILWGSKDSIKLQVTEKNNINEIIINTLSPTTNVTVVEESSQNDILSWYYYFLDSSMYIHDKLEPILGTGLFYLELFVMGNLLMVCLCFFLVDLLIIIKFLELLKKVLTGLYYLFFKL